jgi:hypothetical protein
LDRRHPGLISLGAPDWLNAAEARPPNTQAVHPAAEACKNSLRIISMT